MRIVLACPRLGMSMINLISFRERTAGGEAMASADARGVSGE
jgi:hypothetical protein